MPPQASSRTRFCSAILDEDDDLILTDPEPYTTPQRDDITTTVGDGDSLNLLAFRYYGRADHWWAVADRAGVYDPTLRLDPGSKVTLPSRRTVNEEILNESRRKAFQA